MKVKSVKLSGCLAQAIKDWNDAMIESRNAPRVSTQDLLSMPAGYPTVVQRESLAKAQLDHAWMSEMARWEREGFVDGLEVVAG